MMTFETDDETGVMEFVVDGGVTRAEYDAAIPAMEAVIAKHGKLNGVAMVRSFSGMEMGAWWRDIGWGVGHLSKIGRVALVTDVSWLEMASKVAAPFYPGELKLFPLAEVEAARAWARG
ncbi:STAS/SEC14 domain-containing protein [Sphingomonas sp. G-3-2-10]|uniref:STAS/SEC14 domain-containing protein n=1 Tax=Sphingomonas sp. G-3-2-10 TaxID=2728838 RepID=UPI00146CC768|nr:STAS/SEC14 domain-containing protein [Sphingomonas sp. G-3-2-10]NML06686.1 STAS/SEC14 domain-containing protein [Sphingomonas sp. G-3-2-10]